MPAQREPGGSCGTPGERFAVCRRSDGFSRLSGISADTPAAFSTRPASLPTLRRLFRLSGVSADTPGGFSACPVFLTTLRQ